MHQHDARVRAEARFADSAQTLAAQTASLVRQLADAEHRVRTTADTVTMTRTAYRTVRDTVILQPLTHADTVHDIQILPGFVVAADVALKADSIHQAAAADALTAAGALADGLRAERDLWRNAKAYHAPRFATGADVLYDPVSRVPMASANADLRLTDRLAIRARADQRFAAGEHPVGYVGLHIAF